VLESGGKFCATLIIMNFNLARFPVLKIHAFFNFSSQLAQQYEVKRMSVKNLRLLVTLHFSALSATAYFFNPYPANVENMASS
jgi:hypothetical protein